MLSVAARVADRWGSLNVPDPIPTVDGLLAATALVHDLVLVTRSVRDVERTGVRLLNPTAARTNPEPLHGHATPNATAAGPATTRQPG